MGGQRGRKKKSVDYIQRHTYQVNKKRFMTITVPYSAVCSCIWIDIFLSFTIHSTFSLLSAFVFIIIIYTVGFPEGSQSIGPASIGS